MIDPVEPPPAGFFHEGSGRDVIAKRLLICSQVGTSSQSSGLDYGGGSVAHRGQSLRLRRQ